MTKCSRCGRPVAEQRGGAPSACVSCSSNAEVAASTTPARPRGFELESAPWLPDASAIEARLALLDAYADIVHQDVSEAKRRVARALWAGNSRPFRAEVNRLARAYVEMAEAQFR